MKTWTHSPTPRPTLTHSFSASTQERKLIRAAIHKAWAQEIEVVYPRHALPSVTLHQLPLAFT